MFRKAERRKSKLRLALNGPSGSGKTYGALELAKGLGGKTALLDTEHGSGDLYADKFEYDVAPLEPPYTPDRYIEIIKAAEDAGYNNLIIDSLSHAWSGEGGVLDMQGNIAAASKSGNSFSAWREVTPKHNKLVEAILGSKMHIIATMRTKTAYEIVDDDKGKKKPVKLGMAPVQRDGVEYEFTVVLDISVDKHIATSSKDRTGIFDGKYVTLSKDVGVTLLNWLESGEDLESVKNGFLHAINHAETMDMLKEVFIEAVEFANKYRDSVMKQEFIAAKDNRKDHLALNQLGGQEAAQ